MIDRGIRAGAVLAAAALLLSGCSLLRGTDAPVPTPSRSTHTATPIATPSGPPPSPLPSPSLTPIAAGTPVASGSVVSPKGSVHFSFRVVATGDGSFSVQYSGFSSTLPVPVSAALEPADPAIAVGDGLGTTRYADTVLSGAGATTTLEGVGHDPSFLTQLVTYSSTDGTQAVPVELGPDKVLAVTTVHWSVPVRQSNVHPVDGGERYYAYGLVTASTASGAPATYLVAHGDRASVVAQRFGISLQDLLFLNPSVKRYGKGKDYLYEGTSLNLDPNAL